MATLKINVEKLNSKLKSDDSFIGRLTADTESALKEVQENPLDWDKWIYRIVVLALGFAVLSIVLGLLILIGMGLFKDNSTVITILASVGSGALGALTGLLAPPPNTK